MEPQVDRNLNLDLNLFCLFSIFAILLGFVIAFVDFFVAPDLGHMVILFATTALLCQLRGQTTRMLVRELRAFNLGREIAFGEVSLAEVVRPLR
jgi:hypothetical protein